MEESTLALAQTLARQTIHEEAAPGPPGSPRAARSHASILAEKVQGFRWVVNRGAIGKLEKGSIVFAFLQKSVHRMVCLPSASGGQRRVGEYGGCAGLLALAPASGRPARAGGASGSGGARCGVRGPWRAAGRPCCGSPSSLIRHCWPSLCRAPRWRVRWNWAESQIQLRAFLERQTQRYLPPSSRVLYRWSIFLSSQMDHLHKTESVSTELAELYVPTNQHRERTSGPGWVSCLHGPFGRSAFGPSALIQH
jgi:hypothetical protein